MAGVLASMKILTSMKFAMLRHSAAGLRQVGWVIGGLLVLATWAATWFAASAEVRAEVVMLLTILWAVGAAIGPVLMSGAGVLRVDYFTLLPLDRSRLALALVGSTFPGVAAGYVLLAVGAVVLHAVLLAPLAVPVAVVGAALGWVVLITLSRLVYAALGSAMRTWLGVEIAGIQFGAMIAAMLVGWMIVTRGVQTVPELIAGGLGDDRTAAALAAFPSSWAVLAVDAAAGGRWAVALGWLLALLVLAAALLGLAARVLRPNLGRAGARRRRRRPPLGSRVLTGAPILPTSPLGAVIGREVRQWWRDPWRALELRSGVYTGLLTGLFAYLSIDYAGVAPLAGLVIAFMICLGGCNLYGQDGTAVWLTVVAEEPRVVRADIRGRQLALALLFGPPAALVSVVLILLAGAHWAWPVVLAGLPALIGVACGVAIVLSVAGVSPGVDPRRRVGPNDAGGDLGLQAQIAFWATSLLVLPTAAAVVLGFTAGRPGGPWLAVGVGVLNGALAYWLLGRLAISYFATRLPTVFTRIRYGRTDAGTPAGSLGWLEHSSQDYEAKAREQKEKAKRTRAEKRARAGR